MTVYTLIAGILGFDSTGQREEGDEKAGIKINHAVSTFPIVAVKNLQPSTSRKRFLVHKRSIVTGLDRDTSITSAAYLFPAHLLPARFAILFVCTHNGIGLSTLP